MKISKRVEQAEADTDAAVRSEVSTSVAVEQLGHGAKCAKERGKARLCRASGPVPNGMARPLALIV